MSPNINKDVKNEYNCSNKPQNYKFQQSHVNNVLLRPGEVLALVLSRECNTRKVIQYNDTPHNTTLLAQGDRIILENDVANVLKANYEALPVRSIPKWDGKNLVAFSNQFDFSFLTLLSSLLIASPTIPIGHSFRGTSASFISTTSPTFR